MPILSNRMPAHSPFSMARQRLPTQSNCSINKRAFTVAFQYTYILVVKPLSHSTQSDNLNVTKTRYTALEEPQFYPNRLKIVPVQLCVFVAWLTLPTHTDSVNNQDVLYHRHFLLRFGWFSMNRVLFDGLPREGGAPDSGTLQVISLIWKYRSHVTEIYEFDDIT